MAGFPNTPTIGQIHSIGTVTWEWNGVAWVVKSGTIVDIALSDLTDVTISSPNSNQVLKYNGSEWVNDNLDGGTF
jgi:hypothetical protein